MKAITKGILLLLVAGFLLACASKPAPAGPQGPTERERAEAREREVRRELPEG